MFQRHALILLAGTAILVGCGDQPRDLPHRAKPLSDNQARQLWASPGATKSSGPGRHSLRKDVLEQLELSGHVSRNKLRALFGPPDMMRSVGHGRQRWSYIVAELDRRGCAELEGFDFSDDGKLLGWGGDGGTAECQGQVFARSSSGAGFRVNTSPGLTPR